MKNLIYPVAINWEVVSLKECGSDSASKNFDFDENSINVMDEEYYCKVAKEIAKTMPVKVILSGIYSLNAFDNIKEAVNVLLENNIFVNIHTTLFYISEEMINFFSGKNVELLITLPFEDDIILDETTGKIIKNELNRLRECNVKFKVNIVASKSNLKFIFNYAKYVKEQLHCLHLFISKASCNINYFEAHENLILNEKDFTDLLNTLLKIEHELNIEVRYLDTNCYYDFKVNKDTKFFDVTKKCMAGVNSFFVTFLGDIKECLRSEKEYGNILDMDLLDVISKIKENSDISVSFDNNIIFKNVNYESSTRDYCSVNSMFTSIINTSEKGHFIIPNLDGFVFKVNPDCRFIHENNCYRISYKDKYIFVSEDFYEYIKSTKYISEINFRKVMKISLKQAETIMNKLEQIGILIVHSN